mmetsp:Transcript_43669/g.123422  ORF Transcript_43669/g.123422 Transcript_43669/m.123422 type:complete len:256 (-) Transcript_43669:416-1183(-)
MPTKKRRSVGLWQGTQKSSARITLPRLSRSLTCKARGSAPAEWLDSSGCARAHLSKASWSSARGMKSCSRMPSTLPACKVTMAANRDALPRILRSSPSGTTTSQTRSSNVHNPELSLRSIDASTSLRTSASAAFVAAKHRTTMVAAAHRWYDNKTLTKPLPKAREEAYVPARPYSKFHPATCATEVMRTLRVKRRSSAKTSDMKTYTGMGCAVATNAKVSTITPLYSNPGFFALNLEGHATAMVRAMPKPMTIKL